MTSSRDLCKYLNVLKFRRTKLLLLMRSRKQRTKKKKKERRTERALVESLWFSSSPLVWNLYITPHSTLQAFARVTEKFRCGGERQRGIIFQLRGHVEPRNPSDICMKDGVLAAGSGRSLSGFLSALVPDLAPHSDRS